MAKRVSMLVKKIVVLSANDSRKLFSCLPMTRDDRQIYLGKWKYPNIIGYNDDQPGVIEIESWSVLAPHGVSAPALWFPSLLSQI